MFVNLALLLITWGSISVFENNAKLEILNLQYSISNTYNLILIRLSIIEQVFFFR